MLVGVVCGVPRPLPERVRVLRARVPCSAVRVAVVRGRGVEVPRHRLWHRSGTGTGTGTGTRVASAKLGSWGRARTELKRMELNVMIVLTTLLHILATCEPLSAHAKRLSASCELTEPACTDQ